MAKSSVRFECQECGASFPTWQGKCTTCGTWDSLLEQTTQKTTSTVSSTNTPIALKDVPVEATISQKTGIVELDMLLGDGFVHGSVTLLGGEPGIGKSTLSLQLAQSLSKKGSKVLYITGEESVSQLQIRANRLGENTENLLVLSETNMQAIIQILDDQKPEVVILDSIQVVHHESLSAVDGSISQVRYCAQAFIQWIKATNAIGIIIGHITKEGNIAGPKVLEHMVDVILYLEGERTQTYRLLRSYKNRYWSTNEVGIFQMKKNGLISVDQPSELFIDDVTLSHPGSVIAPIIEGSRVLLVEVQALVVDTGFGMAKRNMVGVNTHRANLMIATLEKIGGLKLSAKDIFLNIIGGLKVAEPGLDLAMVFAMISSYKDEAVGDKIAVIGEVGLTGEVRAVPHIEKRLIELEKMGFTGCIIPEKSYKRLSREFNMDLFPVSHIRGLSEFTRVRQHIKTAS